jgi:hypothetical protein
MPLPEHHQTIIHAVLLVQQAAVTIHGMGTGTGTGFFPNKLS